MEQPAGSRLGLGTVDPRILMVRARPAVGIAHWGVGNFHRAHMAVYTAAAVESRGGAWGIEGHSGVDSVVPAAMNAQDGLYTVATISNDGLDLQIPGIHHRILGPNASWASVRRQVSDPDVKILSLTVTEAGYRFDASSHGLDLADPLVQADIAATGLAEPATVIGRICSGLAARFRLNAAPMTLLSCDNMEANGERLKGLVLEFIEHNSFGMGPGFRSYVEGSVAFPSSMVDRIVPRVGDALAERVRQELGLVDQCPVVAEPFSMWVVEDDFAAGRPAWEDAGVIFSSDVHAYEQLKLRVLNGGHSALAYIGLLLGHGAIPEAWSDPRLQDFVRRLVVEEIAPTLRLPAGMELSSYLRDLDSRWSNRALNDDLRRIGADGSLKLPERFAPVIRHHVKNGHVPVGICAVIAAAIACWGQGLGLQDPEGAALGEVAGNDTDAFVRAALRIFRLDDISDAVTALVTDQYRVALEDGLAAILNMEGQ